jgi:hypothetical protein
VGCGGQINASATPRRLISSYSSRGLNGNYENMLDCRWYVVANPGDSIKLVINDFDVSPCVNGTNCDCDYLEVTIEKLYFYFNKGVVFL